MGHVERLSTRGGGACPFNVDGKEGHPSPRSRPRPLPAFNSKPGRTPPPPGFQGCPLGMPFLRFETRFGHLRLRMWTLKHGIQHREHGPFSASAVFRVCFPRRFPHSARSHCKMGRQWEEHGQSAFGG